MKLDESRPFIPMKIAVLTVSDTRNLEDDKSGATLAERLTQAGHVLAVRAIVTDDVPAIQAKVQAWISDPGIDVVISTGGTVIKMPVDDIKRTGRSTQGVIVMRFKTDDERVSALAPVVESDEVEAVTEESASEVVSVAPEE